ncbi:hypothetical protein HJG60_001864 [Phyllostomus discolor]|uniref:Uncharacterized protein n=1 Tax=Phyllostomus discolor TaxID=89673 RepID=A0A834ENF7_9CHIR|nr:hypothetical protein HJG60_001864 [Phyllostomus discolor]
MSDEDDEEEITADTLRCKPRALPISAQAAFGYVPPRRQDPKEHSYYYRQAKTGIISLYDCVFKKTSGYNQKLHRDDREHAKSLGLHVNEEAQSETTRLFLWNTFRELLWKSHQQGKLLKDGVCLT